MTPDSCRPVEVTVDGQTAPALSAIAWPSTEAAADQARLFLALRRVLPTDQSVRDRAAEVMAIHWPSARGCECGELSGPNAIPWVDHVVNRLQDAGVALERAS